jgi:hypothetical protein
MRNAAMTDAASQTAFRAERIVDPSDGALVDRIVAPPAFNARQPGETDEEYRDIALHGLSIASATIADPALGRAIAAFLERAYALGLAEGSATAEPAPLVAETIVPARRSGLDVDRLVRMYGEGLLVMHYAGGSARSPELMTRTLDGLNTRAIKLHAREDLAARLTRDVISSACLAADPASHAVVGSTISIAATLHVVALDGTKSRTPVTVTIADERDPYCTPLIEEVGTPPHTPQPDSGAD